MSTISVSVSNDNVVLKEISEKSGQTMAELMESLTSLKSQTNEYLTELVEADKTQTKPAAGRNKEISRIRTSGINRNLPDHLPGDSKEQSRASDENSTRPSVVVVPEKKAKVWRVSSINKPLTTIKKNICLINKFILHYAEGSNRNSGQDSYHQWYEE